MTKKEIQEFDYRAMYQLIKNSPELTKQFKEEGFSIHSNILTKSNSDLSSYAKSALLNVYREYVIGTNLEVSYNELKSKNKLNVTFDLTSVSFKQLEQDTITDLEAQISPNYDYPAIEIMLNKKECVTRVEYDSVKNCLQVIVYANTKSDEPTHIIKIK